MTNFLFAVIFATALPFIFVSPAYAYLDPGTGSYFIQIFLAVSVSSLFAIKSFWKQILSLFTRSKQKNKSDEQD